MLHALSTLPPSLAVVCRSRMDAKERRGSGLFSGSGLLSQWFKAILVALCALYSVTVSAFTLPPNFTDEAVIEGLVDPDGFAFSPDGRLFISERISGKLRVARYDSNTDTWTVNATPFYTFDTPSPARRSGGLRDIAFDPNFASNGFVYAFYMDGTSLHNRVVRIKALDTNPNNANSDIADPNFDGDGEQLLIDLPFNNTSSSGSHNGGALEFGGDGKLYITTGDGWEGEFAGDPVQSLMSFTGKVLRINSNGVIPTDNPFYGAATGDYRAIYALGLRNPYSMSKHPDTNLLYINEARGSNKASVYIVAASANYKHEGTGLGTTIDNPWVDASGAGGELITGGAWLSETGSGNFPAEYNGRYFTALWGSNSSDTGRINTVASDSNTTVETFETGIGVVGSNNIPVKPVITRFNSDRELYYMLTTYTTNSGQIRRVRFTSQETVATPVFNPPGGQSDDPVSVTITTTTDAADIYYTLDNTTPTESSTLYGAPVSIDESAILRARAFKVGANNSSEASAVYIIGAQEDNVPPMVDAGEDKTGFIGQAISLDGSGTTDPDGNDDFLTGEQWTKISGPAVTIDDATEEIAFFTPTEAGVYRFRLEVSDGIDIGSDEVTITVIQAPRVFNGLQVLYTFEEGSGTVINDVSGVGTELDLSIDTPAAVTWLANGGIDVIATAQIVTAGATKIIDACKANNEISIEAWVYPDSVTQNGPARIVSLSTDTLNRNFTLGQQDDRYDTRLRTTTTNNNGTPSLTVPASTVKTELTHVVYTRDNNSNAAIYINGQPQVIGTVTGNMSNWNDNYNLLLANEEADGNPSNERPWLGELHLVAVYCEALSANEVAQNFSADLPPYDDLTDSDNDMVVDILDNCPDEPNPDQENLDGDSEGDACDNDIDNDGVNNDAGDSAPMDNKICRDLDSDMCDDCTIGVDGFGPLLDAMPANDGLDTNNDGMCNVGDPDDDGDGEPDGTDNCPLIANEDQQDEDGDGLGDACDPDAVACFVIKANNGNVVTFCL